MPINHLFNHPYTKIDFLMKTLNVSRPSAAKYLDELTEGGFLHKEKIGRSNYYINIALTDILMPRSIRHVLLLPSESLLCHKPIKR